MKRILLLADINSSHTKKWAIGISNTGWKVYIYGLHSPKNDWYSEYGIEIKTFGLDHEVANGSTIGKLKYFKAKNSVRAFADEIKPDIIHAHYATSYGMLGKLVKRRPYVVSIWGSEIYNFPQKSFIHRMFFKNILKYPDVVCSTSHDMTELCQSFVQRPIEIVPFGIDVSLFKSGIISSTEKEKITFGTVKALEPVYGIDRLLKSYAEFRKQSNLDTELVIFGSGTLEQELKKMSIELNIDQHTHFKGFVSGKELIEAYDSLDVYCALSIRESFGVAVLEAESMGIPVIVSDAGGLKEVVKDGQTGFIINNGEIEGVVQAMFKLTDASLRKELGDNGRSFVMNNFNFEKNLIDQIGIYDNLIENDK